MTFICELDPYCLGIRRIANMDFLRQGFRKLSSDRQTDRQTRPKLHTTPLREWSTIIVFAALVKLYWLNLFTNMENQRIGDDNFVGRSVHKRCTVRWSWYRHCFQWHSAYHWSYFSRANGHFEREQLHYGAVRFPLFLFNFMSYQF